ncbi:LytR C-terminal domain-containing protein [Streptomyces sp. A7024]|uniref:LytR C-terminal domain-containing protein n=1 Tax=Streptomyces coryli TaxID=1128680 RepID=A0A6G4UB05_9ACTN|nr:LytR C-terminal domain-containing protein [Streptomyces coryli]NGN68507.1 LytR C-terminal domain-containing protein [Streptomyces coryli]
MSMLTPPGMGGKYKIKGTKYPQMRRSRTKRRVLLLTASAALLALLAWGSVQLVSAFSGDGSKDTAAGKKHCASPSAAKLPKPAPLPKPDTIKVNVLNATTRSGLADKTAKTLEKRGFDIGEVGNAPKEYDKKVDGPGILLGSKQAAEGPLKVLGTQLDGAQPKTDGRKGNDVDLILGQEFVTLAKEKQAQAALKILTKPPAPKPTRTC